MSAPETPIRIVDLFAGIGGLRQGVLQGLKQAGLAGRVVFTSEIKKSAVSTLQLNWPNEPIAGDITQIEAENVPAHDLLLAGFPCQAFSYAGLRKGFADETKGTLFFDVLRILAFHRPEHFILENVEGLVQHDPDPDNKTARMGRTLTTILNELRKLGYHADWQVLNATDYGVPQARKRLFITGDRDNNKGLQNLTTSPDTTIADIMEHGVVETDPHVLAFEQLLTRTYPNLHTIEGSIFRDWRGGARNIHSWNIEFRGETSAQERALLEAMSVEARRSHWAQEGLHRVGEGFPLTIDHINRFHPVPNLSAMLTKLSKQGYLRHEDDTYRIASGRLTMPVSHILRPSGHTNTLVATDANRLAILDDGRLRRFTQTEVKRLFGFPDTFLTPDRLSTAKFFDLFGNSVVVPVAKNVTQSLYNNLVQSSK